MPQAEQKRRRKAGRVTVSFAPCRDCGQRHDRRVGCEEARDTAPVTRSHETFRRKTRSARLLPLDKEQRKQIFAGRQPALAYPLDSDEWQVSSGDTITLAPDVRLKITAVTVKEGMAKIGYEVLDTRPRGRMLRARPHVAGNAIALSKTERAAVLDQLDEEGITDREARRARLEQARLQKVLRKAQKDAQVDDREESHYTTNPGEAMPGEPEAIGKEEANRLARRAADQNGAVELAELQADKDALDDALARIEANPALAGAGSLTEFRFAKDKLKRAIGKVEKRMKVNEVRDRVRRREP